jgi:hypothetical protein
VSPSTRRFRLGLAALLIAAPSTEFVETLLSPLDGESTAEEVRAISMHQSIFVVSVLLGIVATVLYVPAFVGLASVTWERSRKLSAAAGSLVVVAMLGFMGVRMGQGVELQGIRDGLGVERTARLIDGLAANPIGGVIVGLFLGGTVVGLTCMAIAVWRSHVAPWPAALLLLAFPFVDELLPDRVGTIVAHGLLLIGLAWIGLAQLRAIRSADASVHAGTAPLVTAEG